MDSSLNRRSMLKYIGTVGVVTLVPGIGVASAATSIDVNANALRGHWAALRGAEGTNGDGKANQSKKAVNLIIGGIGNDEFDAAVVTFGTFGSMDSRELDDMILRKRPGRTKSGHQIVLPAVQIPEPERDVSRTTVGVALYGGMGNDQLVGSGENTVFIPIDECVENCIE